MTEVVARAMKGGKLVIMKKTNEYEPYQYSVTKAWFITRKMNTELPPQTVFDISNAHVNKVHKHVTYDDDL